MNWAIAGLVYAGVYGVVVSMLADQPQLRLLVGNLALLLPPLAPCYVILRRRGQWIGRQGVFFGTIAAWAALWLIGQIGWAADELIWGAPLPWFSWHIILQLCGSALPLIALIAWPHKGTRTETSVTAAIDIAVLVFLTGFLYWSLIISPGMDPAHTNVALRSLATIGPSVRIAAVIGLLLAWRSAGKNAWAQTYLRLAMGMGLAFALLVGLSYATTHGTYQTGSLGDAGWMLPFWFAAWAAATAPASAVETRSITASPPQHASPVLLYVALLTVPFLGYGLHYIMPINDTVDRLRDVATSFTLVAGIALVMVRFRVEQRAVERANDRVRLLATACEHAGELIVITEGQRIEYANEAFLRALGYSFEELREMAPEQFVAAESRPDIGPLRERIRARHIVRSTTKMRRKDGTLFQAQWSAAPIVDSHGRIRYVVGVIRDMTEDMRLREQVVRSERLSAIGELVSGVAHEMNNPLQSIIGTLDVLLNQPTDPVTRSDLERARREAGRAGRIIRNLLTFARKSPEERLLVDLNEVVQSAVNVRAYELEIAGIKIREEYAPNLPLVLANREAIQQIVANLVVNAQQAMSPNGRGTLTVKTYIAAGHAALEVRDDGPGVAPHIRSRIFEPFVSTKPEVSGTGLGLSLSFGIANAHGGTLELVPTDAGACFRLMLPGAGFAGPSQISSSSST
ncbi:MAG TPA: ATP-binding protein [Vicinamibacterales bacterium]|nr:ATP-binding protein [Vicinamibacterales bacterium]